MGKNRELNEFERKKVIRLWIRGRTHEAISRVLKISKNTITDTISRYKNLNNGLTAKRTGRSCFMNNDNRYNLSKIVKKNNQLSLEEIQQKFNSSQDKKISAVTICRNLYQIGINSRIFTSKPLLIKAQCEK